MRTDVEAAAGDAAQILSTPGNGVQRRSQNFTEEGWKRVRHSKPVRVDADQPPLRDKLQQDGWSVRHSGGIPARKRRGLLGKHERESKVLMAEMHSNGSLAVLAPISVNEKGTQISVLVQDRNGRMQSRRRFLQQLGDVPVQYQSTAPQGGFVKDGGTKQIVLSLSKQYTDKQGWEAAEPAPRVAARPWLQHRAGVEVLDVRPPPRIAGREELQVVAQIASSSRGSSAREWKRRRDDPSFLHWQIALGVVTTRLGPAVRVKIPDFEKVARLVQPENYNKFLGELWDVSGLPLSWGPDAVTDCLTADALGL